MAIVFYTGVPGAGKTLRSIHDALKYKAEGRLVYQLGIDGMDEDVISKYPYDSLEDWRKLPVGSVLIVDEAHKYLPVRSPGKPPEWIQALTEIRHHGIELWLVTQDPRNIDSFVRRLAGKHFHLTRKAGLHGAMVREFQGIAENPDDFNARKSSDQVPWKYPKHLFNVYKSATLHVVKPKFPKKILFGLIVLVAAVVAIPLLILKAKNSYMSVNHDEHGQAVSSVSRAEPQPFPPNGGSSFGSEPMDADKWIELHEPVVPFVPTSAPVWQGRLTPQGVPRMLCMLSGYEPDQKCSCFTERATRINNVPFSVCYAYAKNGEYNIYLPEVGSRSGEWSGGASVSGAPLLQVIPE